MPIPWTGSLLPEAAIAGLVTAVAAGAVGGFIGAAVTRPTAGLGFDGTRRRARAWAAASTGRPSPALLVVLAVVGWGLPISSSGPQSAPGAAERNRRRRRAARGRRHVRISPADGGRGRPLPQRHRLAGRRQRDQRARARRARASTAPPSRSRCTTAGRRSCACTWATRCSACRSTCPRTGPSPPPRSRPGRPSRASSSATCEILQRERKDGVSGWLTAAAYLTVAAIAASLIALIAWALLRLEGLERRPSRWRRSPAARPRTSSHQLKHGATRRIFW